MARGVSKDKQKVVLLLHRGDCSYKNYVFQANEEKEKEFKDCLTVLDEYFVPKVNLPFEGHQF